MTAPHLTAITGGIGAGKSVVSRMLRVMGYEVFDCDREAKMLMDSDPEIKSRLKTEIHSDTVDRHGIINRRLLSSVAFSDPAKLTTLNAIVHSSVRKHINLWRQGCRTKHIFVETAILYQSSLDKMVDDVIEVIAPVEVRVKRVMERNNYSREEVVARMDSQRFTPQTAHPFVTELTNDNVTPILPQLRLYLRSSQK